MYWNCKNPTFWCFLSIISYHSMPQHLQSTLQDLIPRGTLSQKWHIHTGPIHNRYWVSRSLIVWDVRRCVCTHIIVTMSAIHETAHSAVSWSRNKHMVRHNLQKFRFHIKNTLMCSVCTCFTTVMSLGSVSPHCVCENWKGYVVKHNYVN